MNAQALLVVLTFASSGDPVWNSRSSPSIDSVVVPNMQTCTQVSQDLQTTLRQLGWRVLTRCYPVTDAPRVE
jgi:hypothetical protein